ncbi:MAG: chemotaxis protein [Sulfuricurvum sp.]|jgi:two-component system chemotaxis response regulator CheV|uniref:chemotaxis protein n=1 Tax=Sulfuricurvum sp. TaxID=2025608 RepID=UPI0025FB474F|nr:chemotaxis protein [Sulfuricurvum sp.]MCK9373243.1 chemotaxis protein [Sulfuricurvum sp.]
MIKEYKYIEVIMSLLENVDAATNLAKNNEVQLLVFKIDASEGSPYYAINVFKTREVVEAKRHHLTLIPGTHPLLEGSIVLREVQIPILNLPKWLGVELDPVKKKTSNLLICDFNGVIIGIRIMYAYRVIKKNWSEMHAPDSYSLGDEGLVINDTRLDDGSLCLVLDYEKLLSEVIPQAMVNVDKALEGIKNLPMPEKLKNGTVLIAEDSKTAQRHLRNIFDRAHLSYQIFNNGKDLIEFVTRHPDPASIPAVITDIEMPEMSGFTVIQRLKANPLTKAIPIIVNSSMTGENNKREAAGLGADGFIDKTKSENILPLIIMKMEAAKQKLLS